MCLCPQTLTFKQELMILFKSKKSDSPETWASLAVFHPLYRTWVSVIVSLKVFAVSLRNWSKDNRSDSGKYCRQSRQSTSLFFFPEDPASGQEKILRLSSCQCHSAVRNGLVCISGLPSSFLGVNIRYLLILWVTSYAKETSQKR